MIGGGKGDVELVCPQCKEKVVTTAKEAATGRVKCSRGHEILVVGAMDMGMDVPPTKPSG